MRRPRARRASPRLDGRVLREPQVEDRPDGLDDLAGGLRGREVAPPDASGPVRRVQGRERLVGQPRLPHAAGPLEGQDPVLCAPDGRHELIELLDAAMKAVVVDASVGPERGHIGDGSG